MMQIVYFSQKEQFLTEMESIEGEKVYVAPSPAKADGLRTRLKGNSGEDVITIAKFTSNLVSALWAQEEKPQVKRKAELLLIFGILKNKYLPDLGYEQFSQAYNLFSDLRSFTLNHEALSSVLDEQPQIIKDAVLLFWKLLELTEYHDEHSAYHQIAEKLRASEEIEDLNKVYVFWGFQHLNGQQVDLLKALSIRYTVIIPFPLSLKDKVKRSDWVSWIKDSRTSEKELSEIDSNPKAKWVPVNSREISLQLKSAIQKGDQILLGVSKLSPSHLDLVPSQNVSYKIPHELLTLELKKVHTELKKFVGTHLELHEVCQEGLKKSSNMKMFRAWQLYSEALQSIDALTDGAVNVDSFFLKLLSDVANLNQPRTSFVPVSPKELDIDLKDMSSLEDVDRSRRVLLCIDERFEDIQGLGQNYTESIQKALSAVGPLKRNELELLFKQWEFRDLFSHADVTVYMSEGTLKHSLIWKRLFIDIDLTKVEGPAVRVRREIKDHFSNHSKQSFNSSFSASKLQTYLDCPRKFYFNYIEKIFPDVLLEKDFDPMTSGAIIHELIEDFFKKGLNDDELANLTKTKMNHYIRENKLVLPKEVYLQRELIFNHRAMNGIQFVRNLEQTIGEKIDWKIEEPFETSVDFNMKGRIDCLGISDKFIFLLDFKSTEFAASSNTEISDYQSVQLWVYALAAQGLIPDYDKKSVVVGYVVLDDSSKSNLLTSDEDLVKVLKDSKICKVQKFKEEFNEKIIEAREKLISLTLAISSEKEFSARPRSKSTCDFCDLNKVCIKSELNNVPVT